MRCHANRCDGTLFGKILGVFECTKGVAVSASSRIPVWVATWLALAAVAHGQQLPPGPGETAPPGPVRVIEQDLLVTDPTVAAPRHWLVGAALEGWYVTTPNAPYSTPGLSGSQTATGSAIGGNVTVGYDDIWAILSYRAGSFKDNVSLQVPFISQFTNSEKLSEVELKFRYLFRDIQIGGMTPYALGGYHFVDVDSNKTFTTPGPIWVATGTPTFLRADAYNSAFAGFGGIVPFNRWFGVRADIVAAASYGFQTNSNVLPGFSTKQSGPGMGAMAHATVYFNLVENLTLQLGVKGAKLWMYNMDDYGAIGGYVNLGYISRF
jgi:hypothetical protein